MIKKFLILGPDSGNFFVDYASTRTRMFPYLDRDKHSFARETVKIEHR